MPHHQSRSPNKSLTLSKPQMVALTSTIALMSAQIPANAGTGEWGGSVSIAKSKADHLYIGNVEMSPASFCLAGKIYQVREAWLELEFGLEFNKMPASDVILTFCRMVPEVCKSFSSYFCCPSFDSPPARFGKLLKIVAECRFCIVFLRESF